MGEVATQLVVSVSGGKDSTAMALHLREEGHDFRALFCDTGWEAPETYEYVREVLPVAIGCAVEWRRLEVELDPEATAMAQEVEALVGVDYSAFVRLMLRKACFPSRRRRFCTSELKIKPSAAFMGEIHATGAVPLNAVGVRAAESAARAKLPERELSPSMDCMVWRPIIRWTERDVIGIHHRHGVRPNPLYVGGFRRVGCYPCVMSRKDSIRRLADRSPRRVAAIELLERRVGQIWESRATEERKAKVDRLPTMFQATRRDAEGRRPCVPFAEVVEWSRTKRGSDEPDPEPLENEGCVRWGLCEPVQAGLPFGSGNAGA